MNIENKISKVLNSILKTTEIWKRSVPLAQFINRSTKNWESNSIPQKGKHNKSGKLQTNCPSELPFQNCTEIGF